jgi:hypothetical protein
MAMFNTAFDPPHAKYRKVWVGIQRAKGLWKKSMVPTMIFRATLNNLYMKLRAKVRQIFVCQNLRMATGLLSKTKSFI